MKTKWNFWIYALNLYIRKTERIHGQYSNYRTLCIRLKTGQEKLVLWIRKTEYKNNLSFAERKALTEMKHDKNKSIYRFEKRTGFVVIKEENAIQKIEEQIEKLKVIDHDPTPTLLNKFRKELAKLRKRKQIWQHNIFQIVSIWCNNTTTRGSY